MSPCSVTKLYHLFSMFSLMRLQTRLVLDAENARMFVRSWADSLVGEIDKETNEGVT